MFCNRCGSQIPDGSKFCMTCGTPLPEVEARCFCPYCGAEKTSMEEVCQNCGPDNMQNQQVSINDFQEIEGENFFSAPMISKATVVNVLKRLAVVGLILLTFVMMLFPVYDFTYKEEAWKLEIWRDDSFSASYEGDYDSLPKNYPEYGEYYAEYSLSYGSNGLSNSDEYRKSVDVVFPAINSMSDEKKVTYLNNWCVEEESTSFGFEDERGRQKFFFFMYHSDWEETCVPIFVCCFWLTLIFSLVAMVLFSLTPILEKKVKIVGNGWATAWFIYVIGYVLTWLMSWEEFFFTDGIVNIGFTVNGYLLIIISVIGIVVTGLLNKKTLIKPAEEPISEEEMLASVKEESNESI